MNSSFEKLSEEKQKNIIKAAINEFAKDGYDNASTDKIAEAAGIAKGSLFHYFGSKKNLYLFTVEHCINLLTNEILKEAESYKSNDFYERIKAFSFLKQKMLAIYPLHSKIIMDAFINMPGKVKGDLEKLYIKYYSTNMSFIQEYLLQYVNTDLLRPSVTKEEVLFVTMSVFDALNKKYMEIYKNRIDYLMNNNDELFEECNKYIEIIKHGLYK